MQIVVKAIQEAYSQKDAPRRIFDSVIVDNAQVVNEIETCLLMNDLRPGKLILIGDSQLPSNAECTMPYSIELQFNRSLFDRLI